MNLRIEPLTREHDRNGFDCSDESINLFLREKAMQDQRLDLSRTMVLVKTGENARRVIGYHTMLISQVQQEEIPDDRPKITRDIPVIMLGQIGIDVNFQGKGFGERLMLDVQERVSEISQMVGVRALMLAARTESLAGWYQKHDFLTYPGSLRMFKSIQTIRKFLG